MSKLATAPAPNPATPSTQGEHKPKLFFGYLVVFALILSICVPMALGLNCAGIFYTPLSKELGVSTGQLSYYTAFLWGAGLLILPFLGILLDKVDSRICVGGSVLLIALDFIWLSFVHELWQYYVGAFVMGLGVTMLNLMAPSTIVNRWFAKRAGFYVGLILAFAGIGGVIFNAVGGSLILSIGWSGTYLVFAALSALTLPVCWFCIRSYPKDKGLLPHGIEDLESESGADVKAALKQAEGGMPAKKAFRTKTFLLIFVICFLMNSSMYTYYILPSYVDTLAIAVAFPMLGALAASCAMGGQIVTKLTMGALSDKVPFVGTAICIGLGCCGVLTLTFGGFSAILIYLGAIGYGLFHGATNVMLPVFTERAFGNKDYAKIYARISMSSCFAGVVSGLVLGTLIHLTGSYLPVFLIIAAMMILAIVLVISLSRQPEEEHEGVSSSEN